ncbi:MAG: DegV family protein [Micromonosporaceae bacterium]
MSPQRSGAVAVVTDSTAYLPGEEIDRYAIRVVPIHVVIGGVSRPEGTEVTPADVARALRQRRTDVTTSRPSPDEFGKTYGELLDSGYGAVVSVHMSRKLSGTYDAAQRAAEEYEGRVVVLDSGSTGMGLGFPVLAAAEAATEGGDIDDVCAAATAAISRTTSYFYVDTLEYLRRGGRIGAAEALLGTALAVKPILQFVDGSVVIKEKVRTAGRALARLEQLAVAAAGDGAVDVAVHHLDAAERAAELGDHLRTALPELGALYTSELGGAVGAHVGPGSVCAVVSRRAT